MIKLDKASRQVRYLVRATQKSRQLDDEKKSRKPTRDFFHLTNSILDKDVNSDRDMIGVGGKNVEMTRACVSARINWLKSSP